MRTIAKKYILFITIIFSMFIAGLCPIRAKAASAAYRLNKTYITLSYGDSTQICVYKGSKTVSKVAWSSANRKIASVNSKGTVKAAKCGTTYISVRVAGRTLKCRVKVVNKPRLLDFWSCEGKYHKTPYLNNKPGNRYVTDIQKEKTLKLKICGTSSTAKWSVLNKKAASIKTTGKRTCSVSSKTDKPFYVIAKIDGKTLKCKVNVVNIETEVIERRSPIETETDRIEISQPITIKPWRVCYKPAVYIYNAPDENINVKIGQENMNVTVSYPEYPSSGWIVRQADDKQHVTSQGKDFQYLYYEGTMKKDPEWNMEKGFCVKSEDTAEFLDEKLELLGLNKDERDEFIVFWLPLMQPNPYNLISFTSEQYEALVPLDVTPKPQQMVRVYMTYKPLQEPVDIEPQELEKVDRSEDKYTVVEWGGSITE